MEGSEQQRQQQTSDAPAAEEKTDRYVVFYSTDKGATWKVANDKSGAITSEGQAYKGLGKHGGEAKQLVVGSLEDLAKAIREQPEGTVLMGTAPVASFKPRVARPPKDSFRL